MDLEQETEDLHDGIRMDILMGLEQESTEDLRYGLRDARQRFRQQGGRGVEEADYIDAVSIILARRRQQRYRDKIRVRKAQKP